MHEKGKLAVLTGGGDCPGLNAVIRGVVCTSINAGYDIYGVEDGFSGLVEDKMELMNLKSVFGILQRGGTILGTTNRDNPFSYNITQADGTIIQKNMGNQVVENIKKRGIECLIVIGGDGSLKISSELSKLGVRVINVPKTIDNDIPGTERTFGFDTAVSIATEALDRLQTTAESHHRVMVLEVMGRYAGWIALHAGIAGGADVILLPEIPFSFDLFMQKIKDRANTGKGFSLVVVAEGAKEIGGEVTIARTVANSFESIRLGGIGQKIADRVEKETGIESRCAVLGHIQRGGCPTAYDRVLSTRYGVAAVEAFLRGEYNVMVAIQYNKIVTLPIASVADQMSLVPIESELVINAKRIGVSFGD